MRSSFRTCTYGEVSAAATRPTGELRLRRREPWIPTRSQMPDRHTIESATRTHERRINVVPYHPARPNHRSAFRELNLAWIEAHFVVEPRDRDALDDPEGHVLAAGGGIERRAGKEALRCPRSGRP